MTEVLTYEALKAERDTLAVENAELKKFCKNAAFDADYESELCMERGGFTDALNNIETPATDAALAAIQAQGVERAAAKLYGSGYVFEVLMRHAAELREAK
ncbi:hypothetical protein CU560_18535 [Serratia ureilytica]|nr:hypothetical protein CU560_18535 [Serratia ureilytica]